ncbi:MAG TPA: glycosyltransferase family 2 protein [Candidatus Saccharimonadales bacterium]|nr:glycosyltransferase family 2 protein [Candidatus Saccharimonadales bacterium]
MLVSVVIPTYNAGWYLEAGIASLMRQTLPRDAFEVIAVDDGSTDDTPARLDAMADRYPNLSVVRSEHSGWPGRPRNIGIERARGEFIQFMDQDDEMSPDSLRRLVAMGQENHADIVLGKVTSDFRPVALGLYARNRPSCTIHDAPLIDSLTPHKMFRRTFLAEHAIAFPEGRRRLEDQLFVVKAYFAASSVSILADEPCYFYLKRDVAAQDHIGSLHSDPPGYYDNLREVLDVVIANTEPGAARARILRRFCRVQMLLPLRTRRFLGADIARQARLFADVRGVYLDYIDELVEAGIGAVGRIRGALIRSGRLDALIRLNQRLLEPRAPSRVTSARWDDGKLRLKFSAGIDLSEGRLLLRRHGGRTQLDPALADGIVSEPIDVTDEVEDIGAGLLLHERATAVEWAVPSTVTLSLAEDQHSAASMVPFQIEGTATIDPERLAVGRPLGVGEWEVRTRINAFGLDLAPYPLGDAMSQGRSIRPLPPLYWPPDRLVRSRVIPGSGATVEVSRVDRRPKGAKDAIPVGAAAITLAAVHRTGRRIRRRLPGALRQPTSGAYRWLRSRIRSLG